jgi:hypothetical protein
MTKKEQEQFFDVFTAKMKSIMVGKGDDYATHDRLSNFKFSGSIVGTGKDGRLACLQLIAVKVARLGTLLNSKEGAKNESIDDSILDLANYSVLLAMLQSELTNVTHVRDIAVGMDIYTHADLMSFALKANKKYKVTSKEDGKFSVINNNGHHIWFDDKDFDTWFNTRRGEEKPLEVKKGSFLCAKKEAAQFGFFEGVNYMVHDLSETKVLMTIKGNSVFSQLKEFFIDEIDDYFTPINTDTAHAVQLRDIWRKEIKEGEFLKSLTTDENRGFTMSLDYLVKIVELGQGEYVTLLNNDNRLVRFHLSQMPQLFSATKP